MKLAIAGSLQLSLPLTCKGGRPGEPQYSGGHGCRTFVKIDGRSWRRLFEAGTLVLGGRVPWCRRRQPASWLHANRIQASASRCDLEGTRALRPVMEAADRRRVTWWWMNFPARRPRPARLRPFEPVRARRPGIVLRLRATGLGPDGPDFPPARPGPPDCRPSSAFRSPHGIGVMPARRSSGAAVVDQVTAPRSWPWAFSPPSVRNLSDRRGDAGRGEPVPAGHRPSGG